MLYSEYAVAKFKTISAVCRVTQPNSAPAVLVRLQHFYILFIILIYYFARFRVQDTESQTYNQFDSVCAVA